VRADGSSTRLTYAAVPGLVARGGGTIINIASIVAIGPEVLNGVYGGSTKAFVLAFSQSLHHAAEGQKHPRPGGSARRDGRSVRSHAL
jgi:short-subunit dehydrogenase